MHRNASVAGKSKRRGLWAACFAYQRVRETELRRFYFAKLARNRSRGLLIAKLREQSLACQNGHHRTLLWRYYSRLVVNIARCSVPKWKVKRQLLHQLQARSDREILARGFFLLKERVLASRRDKVLDTFRSISEKSQLQRYNSTLLDLKNRKAQKSLICSLVDARSKAARRALTQGYFSKLLCFASARFHTRLTESLAKMEEKHRGARQEAKDAQHQVQLLADEVLFLKTALEEKKCITREVQGAHNDLHVQHSAALQEISHLRKEMELMRQRYFKSLERFNHRPLKLSSAAEVYKLLSKTEECVKQCRDEVQKRQLHRSELNRHFASVCDCITTVKRYQKICMRESFTDEEKLTSNLSGVIHGKHLTYCPAVISQLRITTPPETIAPNSARVSLACNKNSSSRRDQSIATTPVKTKYIHNGKRSPTSSPARVTPVTSNLIPLHPW